MKLIVPSIENAKQNVTSATPVLEYYSLLYFFVIMCSRKGVIYFCSFYAYFAVLFSGNFVFLVLKYFLPKLFFRQCFYCLEGKDYLR